ncbi:MAG: retroviral-like aspartic protease family protein [Sphingomicrobium sp.]
MGRHRNVLALVLGLGFAAGPTFAGAAVEPPKINKPRPVPIVGPLSTDPLPLAAIDDALEISGEDVKARRVESRLNVDVRLNGRGPYRFVVDSGADTSVIGLKVARDLELPLGTPATLTSMTSRDIVDRVLVKELTVGSNRVPDMELPALREAALGGHGIIGIDALSQQRLMLDFGKHTIRIEDARRPERYLPGAIVVTAKRRRGQLILTHVRAGGVPLDAVIDTGSEVTIGNMALRDKLIGRSRNAPEMVEMYGVTGVPVKLPALTIDEIRLGTLILQNVRVVFADLPPFALFGLSDQPALLLGSDVLESFRRVSLDFRARKVRFQTRDCEVNHFTYRMSALGDDPRDSSVGATSNCWTQRAYD